MEEDESFKEYEALQFEYFTLTQLKKGKWDEASIDVFLGAPDKRSPNPFKGRNGNKKNWMQLYLKSRVSEVENSPDFLKWYSTTKHAKRQDTLKELKENI